METIKKWFQSVKEFYKEVKAEILRVSYPTRDEVVGSTTVVIVLTIVITIFLATADSILVRLLRWAF
ncbi:MAG: preprotein translocase subunit SecE [Nitrospirota bacterium]